MRSFKHKVFILEFVQFPEEMPLSVSWLGRTARLGSGEQSSLVVLMLAALLFGQASADGVQFFQPPVAGYVSRGAMVSQAVPVPVVRISQLSCCEHLSRSKTYLK